MIGKTEGAYLHILWWLLVGRIAGWATGEIMRGAGYGIVAEIVLGIVGAMTGGYLMRWMGYTGEGGLLCTVGVAIAGGITLTVVVRLITGRGVSV
ncbi:MAG: GlsB/YeaQ/YmgE family stress response membrane protein [Acidobacteriia bacterium]|nr:GlsB/YeaQ/YmgE family stress response membrane protein [Terriglobia bacterium]